jgi:hypothetical protein
MVKLTAKAAFKVLWNSIHDKNEDGESVSVDAWDANPWVAVYGFERVNP